MKIKIHEFKLIVPERTGDEGGGVGQYVLSNSFLTIPEQMLNQQAVVETLLDGVNGINECCSRIYVEGNNWLVLGDIRSVCYTNDILVVKY